MELIGPERDMMQLSLDEAAALDMDYPLSCPIEEAPALLHIAKEFRDLYGDNGRGGIAHTAMKNLVEQLEPLCADIPGEAPDTHDSHHDRDFVRRRLRPTSEIPALGTAENRSAKAAFAMRRCIRRYQSYILDWS